MEGCADDVDFQGAGQAGLMIAARLKMLGVKALIVDQNERIGDVSSSFILLFSHTLTICNRTGETVTINSSYTIQSGKIVTLFRRVQNLHDTFILTHQQVRPHAIHSFPISLAHFHTQRQTRRILRLLRQAPRAKRLDVLVHYLLHLLSDHTQMGRNHLPHTFRRQHLNTHLPPLARHYGNRPLRQAKLPLPHPQHLQQHLPRHPLPLLRLQRRHTQQLQPPRHRRRLLQFRPRHRHGFRRKGIPRHHDPAQHHLRHLVHSNRRRSETYVLRRCTTSRRWRLAPPWPSVRDPEEETYPHHSRASRRRQSHLGRSR